MAKSSGLTMCVLHGHMIRDERIETFIHECCSEAWGFDPKVVTATEPDLLGIAENDHGQPVGMYALAIGTGVVEFLGVPSEYRRCGVGTFLESHMVAYARRLGWKFIRTRPMLDSRNEASIAFLNSTGWKEMLGSIRMWRNLVDIPRVDTPDGCTIRPYRSGDDGEFIHILKEAFVGAPEWTTEDLKREYLDSPHFAGDRLLFAVCDGKPVGTATAWTGHHEGREVAGLDWVAVLPTYQRRGIGRALSIQALHFMQTHGYEEVVLDTREWLASAVRLYHRLGFRDVFRFGIPFFKQLHT